MKKLIGEIATAAAVVAAVGGGCVVVVGGEDSGPGTDVVLVDSSVDSGSFPDTGGPPDTGGGVDASVDSGPPPSDTGPSGSTPAYARCASAFECVAGTACLAANTTTGSSTGSFCTSTCTGSGSACPASPIGGSPLCVVTASGGQCYAPCGADLSCPVGFACAMDAAGTRFCTPGTTTTPPPTCGGIGQPCCTGNTCTATNAACGTTASGNVCLLVPYAGCSGASLGAACLGGTGSTGAPVGTSCQRPMVANAGPDGFCTATCLGGMDMCPTYADLPTNCYLLSGAGSGQCYAECVSGTGCPSGTECVEVMPMGVAGTVRICMPPVL